MLSRVGLVITALLTVDCGFRTVDSRTHPNVEALAADAPSHHIVLPTGETLEVTSGVMILRGPEGEERARNTRIARMPDPGDRCPADGFVSIRVVGEAFEIRNQLCSGWFSIDEIMLFVRAPDGFRLARISAQHFDRRAPETVDTPRVLTADEFGVRRFAELDPDELYALFE